MSSDSSSNDELDMLSESFNPIKAIYAENVQVPCTNAKPMDNLSRFGLTPSGELIIKREKSQVII